MNAIQDIEQGLYKVSIALTVIFVVSLPFGTWDVIKLLINKGIS